MEDLQFAVVPEHLEANRRQLLACDVFSWINVHVDTAHYLVVNALVEATGPFSIPSDPIF